MAILEETRRRLKRYWTAKHSDYRGEGLNIAPLPPLTNNIKTDAPEVKTDELTIPPKLTTVDELPEEEDQGPVNDANRNSQDAAQ